MSIFKQTYQYFHILMALVLAVFPAASSAINLNPPAVKGVARAYGFVLAQEFSLSRIAKEFPELSGGVELARAQFGSSLL